MNAIEQLREGILTGHWQTVCDGFENMTGMKLDPPTTSDQPIQSDAEISTIKAIHSLTSKYLSLVTEAVDYEEPEPQPAPVKPARPAPKPIPAKTAPKTTKDKFHIEHRGTRSNKGEGAACRAIPFQPGMTNTFQDDGTIAAEEIAASKKLAEIKAPEPRRDPPQKVHVVCCKCEKEEDVIPLFAPKSFDKEDGESSYVCNSCIKAQKGGSR